MNLEGKSLLIVDDEAVILRLFSRALSKLGCSITLSGGVREALAMIESRDFDLLLTDLRLADGSGIEIVSRFHERHPDRGILIVTGSLTPDESLTSIPPTAQTEVICKPVPVEDLRRAVERVYRASRP